MLLPNVNALKTITCRMVEIGTDHANLTLASVIVLPMPVPVGVYPPSPALEGTGTFCTCG
jgi:hypothetical protein